jgi:hypothetical protein
MKLKHMNVRVLLSSLLAVLALSAVAASAAQAAVESPYFKVGGSRLEAGKSQELKAAAYGNYVLSVGSVTITCTKMSAAAGSKIIGSAVGKAATAEATFTYSGCSVSGEPAECKITEVKTQPLLGTAVLNEGKSDVEMLLKPASKKTFAKIENEGKEISGCNFLSSTITGDLVVGLREGGGKNELIQVGKEPAEAHSLVISVPSQPRWVYDEKADMEVEELTDLGSRMSVAGSSTLELAGGSLWGVFT